MRGRVEIGVDGGLGEVVRRNIVPLPALLVQPDPPALPLREVVLDAHPDHRTDAAERVDHDADERPVSKADDASSSRCCPGGSGPQNPPAPASSLASRRASVHARSMRGSLGAHRSEPGGHTASGSRPSAGSPSARHRCAVRCRRPPPAARAGSARLPAVRTRRRTAKLRGRSASRVFRFLMVAAKNSRNCRAALSPACAITCGTGSSRVRGTNAATSAASDISAPPYLPARTRCGRNGRSPQ